MYIALLFRVKRMEAYIKQFCWTQQCNSVSMKTCCVTEPRGKQVTFYGTLTALELLTIKRWPSMFWYFARRFLRNR